MTNEKALRIVEMGLLALDEKDQSERTQLIREFLEKYRELLMAAKDKDRLVVKLKGKKGSR